MYTKIKSALWRKDGKRGPTKENTGMNRKTEDIEINRMGMTKTKYKKRNAWRCRKVLKHAGKSSEKPW
jgi:hypothetical protein